MIKIVIALGFAGCAAASPAQFIIAGVNPTSMSSSGGYQSTSQSGVGYLGDGVTPTMRRQREERAAMTRAFIAASPEKWTSSNPRRARILYVRAARAARWAHIEARRDAM